jgi:RND family efflux transporter MFP subunit
MNTQIRAGLRLLLVTAALAAACGPVAPVEEERPVSVSVQVVEASDISTTAYANTRLEGLEEALIYAMTPGTVEEVLVTEGDSVTTGQQLVRMDTDQQVTAVTAGAVAGISAARANVDFATSNLERMQTLFEAGGVSEQQLENSVTALDAAEAQLNQAYAGYSQARSTRDNAWIAAPFNGLVGRIWARPGNSSGSSPLLSISNNATIVARVLLPETDLLDLRPGLPAYVTLGALDGESFPGVVTSTASSVDPMSGLVAAEVTFADPDPRLRPGMAGRVAILTTTVENAIAVRESVLRRTQSGFQVAVVEDGSVVIREVTTGAYSDGLVQVTSGLEIGDSLIVDGQKLLQNGTPIRVVDR